MMVDMAFESPSHVPFKNSHNGTICGKQTNLCNNTFSLFEIETQISSIFGIFAKIQALRKFSVENRQTNFFSSNSQSSDVVDSFECLIYVNCHIIHIFMIV